MAEFNEQLKLISGLREQCRECDETLYRARLGLKRTNQQLRRAEEKQTVANPDRDREVAALRAQIERLNARLAALREESEQVAQWFATLAEQRRLLEHLQQNLTSIQNRIAALRQHLAELQQQAPPLSDEASDEIKAGEAELARLVQVERDITATVRKATDALRELQDREGSQRAKQDELQREVESVRGELAATQGRLVELLQPAFQDAETLKARTEEVKSTAKRLRDDCGDCEGRLQTAIGELYQRDPHPRNSLRSLDDRTPFLLFPVRLETIFVPVQSAEGLPHTELWVRIYPDEVAVHTHERILTDSEVLAGELYWTELVTAEHLRDERENRRRACWRHLVDLFGGQRSAWIARQTKPADFDSLAASAAVTPLLPLLRSLDADFFADLLALDLSAGTRNELQQAIAVNDGDAFARLADENNWFDRVNALVRTIITGFPVQDLTKTDGWTRAPRTQVMPDRFVLMLFSTEAGTPREVTGNVIPDTLYLGPEPLDPDAGFAEKDDVLVYGSAFDWMSDFDKAVARGMGFRVLLTDAEARNGFAKVFVLGVFLSANAQDSAGLLEELIDSHQFSSKGFTIVPQGTPTNNTERNGTGYSDNDPYDDRAFFTATDPPAFDPANPDPKKSQTDGRVLADALGVAYAPLQTVQHADQTDVLEAHSMNIALFPGTWGYWLRNWIAPVVTEQTARQTRSFFTRFVSGRGPLPAIRIGNQPYGILLTSDFSRWKYPASDGPFVLVGTFQEQLAFLKNLHSLLLELEKTWNGIAATLPFVGKAGSDSSDVLMNILGLHPTSVEFFQRVGYSDEYLSNLLNFKGKGRYANELASLIRSMPATARVFLQNQGVVRDLATVGKMKSLHVLWQHYLTALDAPNLVENKSPSETARLAVNYIDFLAKAESTQKIITQDIGGTPPSALLYLMLRNALLLQLHNGSYEWLQERTTFDSVLTQATSATTLAGMRASQPALSKFEIMATRVDVAEPTHPVPSTTVADWIWNGPPPAEVEAAFLREQKNALQNLAGTPTARLERCLAEHLDCCNYRLDAWQTGLFAQRLQTQRTSGQGRRTGTYLGAFGWVENLKPSVKMFLSADSLPTSLRPADSHPILEEDEVISSMRAGLVGTRQGGFVHAPSLSHAAAAALLRNAYLSHAQPAQAEMFSVNLSSERVRRGQFVLEGMRNGQPIEALLGYQFERGLHDRTSASAARGDIPVLELNEFILPFRQAFLFESREVVQAGTGVPAETVPPYSVVNGLKLSQATLSAANSFGLAAVLPAAQRPNANQGAAIVTEQSALLDTLDAVKDLLMAENAFQLVRGNFDRVAAVSLAQKEAHIPPDLEVINTPRGTEFTFTNRVTLHFDDLDAAPPANYPWPATPTPRARAETGMNKWLGPLLGAAPEKIVCEVHWVETADDGAEKHDQRRVTLAELAVQPVDFVWLVSISPEDTGGATELETRIAYEYRHTNNVGDDKIVRIEFNPEPAAGETTIAQLFPLARQVRALLSESRSLGAEDFLPAAGGKDTATAVDTENPKGYDAAELRARVQSALNALTALAASIDGPTAPSVELVFINDPANPADDETFVGQLGAAFSRLEEAKLTFTDTKQLSVVFLPAAAETLHQKLRAVANFGIGDAFPPESDLTAETVRASLLARAHRTAKRLRRSDPADGVLDRAGALLSQATPEKSIEQTVTLLLAVGKILFGETFNWLPRFTCYNEIDLATAAGDRNQLLAHAAGATPGMTREDVVEEWLQGLARVRRPLHRWEVVRTLADALNDVPLALHPVQVPYRVNDSWLAVAFPKLDPNNTDPDDPDKKFGISRDTLSIAAHGSSAFQVGTRQSGVLLDDWTEEIPTASETTGISFRFNQPNAMPPQTLLLAVTPEETGSWDWDDLVGILTDTLRRARRRAVEPAQLEKLGSTWNALAPALVSEFSTLARNDVSLDLMGMLEFVALTDFYAARAVKP
jgi:predicted  nucleic acid-binding Zn-ribbon protein